MRLMSHNRWYALAIVLGVCGILAGMLILIQLQYEVVGVRTFRMPASSMEPTLRPGDCFLADLKSYRNKFPQRGDIAVFYCPEDRSKFYTKRVIGLEGETIEIRAKKVLINGKAIDDPWGVHRDSRIVAPRDNFGPFTIPKENCFVLGDNRDFSYDSRFWGFVEKEDLHGKALYIYWSDDWNRIGTKLK